VALSIDGNDMTVFEQQVAAALEPSIRQAMRIMWDPDDVAFAVAPRVAAAILAAVNCAVSGSPQPSTLSGEQAALAALWSQE
jgi:hypothetical protein